MWTACASRKKRGRGGGVGGAPPPRSAGSVLSHSPPRCNTNSTLSPTTGRPGRVLLLGNPVVGGFWAVGDGGANRASELHVVMQFGDPQRSLRVSRAFR